MTIYDVLKDSTYKTEQFSMESIECLNKSLVEKKVRMEKKIVV